jgi:hypothetical protein
MAKDIGDLLGGRRVGVDQQGSAASISLPCCKIDH